VYLPSSSKSKKSEDDSEGSPSPVKELKDTKKRKQYNHDSIVAAYNAVKDSNISVHAAAKQYGVPLTTLRDRIDGRIGLDSNRPGPSILMDKDEEKEIVHFLHTMAKYGYRYTRHDIAEIATDQAVETGKRRPWANPLTCKWVDNFISRWPTVKDLSCRFKSKTDAEQTVRTYFDEIKKIIDRFKLLDKGDRIFNIMEISLTTDHSSKKGKSSSSSSHDFVTENITNTTLLSCGSVSGRVMAPFFVFQASKIKPEMMTRVPSNVNASVSETGKCNPQIFRRYLNEHFLPQTQRLNNEPILVLLDGSKSHMFVGMSQWGKANNVIFSFVPHHTTHLLQPLEVECGDLLKVKYDQVCQRHLKALNASVINRNSIGELACQAYFKTLTKHAVSHAFKKAGVFPDVDTDDSGDEDMESDSCRSNSFKGSDDSNNLAPEELVFTEDLGLGDNQEVTEEVVTTSQVTLNSDGQPEEMLMSQDGQLVLTDHGNMVMSGESHLVIHGGEIFVNNGDSGFSHLQLIESDEPLGSLNKPDVDSKHCLLDNPDLGLGMNFGLNVSDSIGAYSCDIDSSSSLMNVKTEYGFDGDVDSSSADDEVPSCARTLPLDMLIRREAMLMKRAASQENNRQSLLQKVRLKGPDLAKTK